uniref:Uncharacterized protein n=1 Tax=Anguilla anguilla TaxID=7936 RepID=A0A0E9XFZ0_ANGAN
MANSFKTEKKIKHILQIYICECTRYKIYYISLKGHAEERISIQFFIWSTPIPFLTCLYKMTSSLREENQHTLKCRGSKHVSPPPCLMVLLLSLYAPQNWRKFNFN